MVFSSALFIFVFLPFFLLLDNILASINKQQWRNILLIIASCIFCVFGDIKALALLLILALVTFIAGQILEKTSSPTIRKLTLILHLMYSLWGLFYYKYLFWLLAELSTFSAFAFLNVIDIATMRAKILPLGISFFTFHAISYVIDIYNHKIGEHKPTDFLAWFVMFPHLIAGPIVRFEQIRQDICHRTRDWSLFSYGLFRFVLGVNKKILIANNVAIFADIAFSMHLSILTTADAWLGIVAYSLQIYFDFSAYSDMAIGLAAMLGIRFEENFRSPYQATSIRDFWRRWHISLSSWLRDYLYIPLGGNRCSKILQYRNLLLVFFLCGLWHGAGWTFVIWGLVHGGFLLLERTNFANYLAKAPLFVARCYTFFVVAIAWVFFRATNLNSAFEYLQTMFSFQSFKLNLEYGLLNLLALIIGVIIIFATKEGLCLRANPKQDNAKIDKTEQNLIYIYAINTIFFAFSLILLYTQARNPFIYFNF